MDVSQQELDIQKQEAKKLIAAALTDTLNKIGKTITSVEKLSDSFSYMRDPATYSNTIIELRQRSVELKNMARDIGRMMP